MSHSRSSDLLEIHGRAPLLVRNFYINFQFKEVLCFRREKKKRNKKIGKGSLLQPKPHTPTKTTREKNKTKQIERSCLVYPFQQLLEMKIRTNGGPILLGKAHPSLSYFLSAGQTSLSPTDFLSLTGFCSRLGKRRMKAHNQSKSRWHLKSWVRPNPDLTLLLIIRVQVRLGSGIHQINLRSGCDFVGI